MSQDIRIAHVIDTRLNVRLHSPKINASKRSWPMEIGHQEEVIRAVYGDNHLGNNIWYELESKKAFIWSGGVTFEDGNPPIPAQKRLIVTADDYGAIPAINLGIRAGVHKGVINSVAAFGNAGPDGLISQKMIRELRQIKNGDTIEIGAHLTLTSGNPITYEKGKELLICNMRRQKFNEVNKPGEIAQESMFKSSKILQSWIKTRYNFYNKTNKNRFIKELKAEWKKQIESVKTGAGGKIDHLTTHCNVHLWHKDFTEVFIELAEEFNIPVRSYHNAPKWKGNWYLRAAGKNFFPKSALKVMQTAICKSNLNVKCPGFLNSRHFGPLPPQVVSGDREFKRLVDKKKNLLSKMFDDLRWSEHESMELMLHLRGGQPLPKQKAYEDELYFQNERGETVFYSGVDHKSFDSRTAECQSIFLGFPKFENGVTKGTWSELTGDEPCGVVL